MVKFQAQSTITFLPPQQSGCTSWPSQDSLGLKLGHKEVYFFLPCLTPRGLAFLYYDKQVS